MVAEIEKNGEKSNVVPFPSGDMPSKRELFRQNEQVREVNHRLTYLLEHSIADLKAILVMAHEELDKNRLITWPGHRASLQILANIVAKTAKYGKVELVTKQTDGKTQVIIPKTEGVPEAPTPVAGTSEIPNEIKLS